MIFRNIFIAMFCFSVLTACTRGQGIYLQSYTPKNQTVENFMLCHRFGCNERTPIQLENKEWLSVKKILKGKPSSAEQERKDIAKAVAKMEKIVLSVAGLPEDGAKAHTFENDRGQMDCLDETVNTSLALQFFQDADLLDYHEVYEPIHRGFFIDGRWPHNSAAIYEKPDKSKSAKERRKASKKIFAVDSYYTKTGGEVYVVPLDTWLAGWSPE